MKELLACVGLAKVRVDAGFSRVGRRLSAADCADRLLMTLAARAVSSGNALMVLCREGHANEALPLLRAVAESALSMRWVCADAAGRAETAWKELEAARWEALWPESRARERAQSFGVPAWAADAALGSAQDFARGNAAGLPWGHMFGDSQLPGRKPEDVLAAAAAWLSLMLEALDRRWPGEFPGAAEMRERAQISRGQ
ncbi:MAG: hypothetical protein A2V88_18145 [Elusimicrobia bacterium RBG_16_66_12]|nr:MAG: hypothetical protein A2V88_18145 [Elusimicrobia bacterium RBG_16_66_12]